MSGEYKAASSSAHNPAKLNSLDNQEQLSLFSSLEALILHVTTAGPTGGPTVINGR